MTPSEKAQRVIERVRQKYPDWAGCQDPRFVQDEIDYKRRASAKALDLLDRQKLEAMLQGGKHDDFLDAFRKAATGNNLLYQAAPRTGDLSVLNLPNDDPKALCHALLDLVWGADPAEARLQRCVDFLATRELPAKWTFLTYYLFLCHPRDQVLIKPTFIKWFLEFLGEPAPAPVPSGAEYRRILDVFQDLKAAMADTGANDMIDMHSIAWVCWLAGRPQATTAARPANDRNRIWKIAPGSDAWQWDECRDGGFIAVGWSGLGDLSGLQSFQDFERRFEEIQPTHPDWKLSGTRQAWTFRNLREGDVVVANKGTTQVLGIGTVTGPYYFAPDVTYGHRVPVEWHDTRLRKVAQGGWRKTIIELDEATLKGIEEAPFAPPPPTARTPFTPKTFELLALLEQDPRAEVYQAHKAEFEESVEQPFQAFFQDVVTRLEARIGDNHDMDLSSLLETSKGLFSRIRKNDFGQGGAWPFLWAAMYPKGRHRIADAQLYASINGNVLDWGFSIGDEGKEVRDFFRKNVQANREELAALFAGRLPNGFVLGDLEHADRGTVQPDEGPGFQGWLSDPLEAGPQVSAFLNADAVLERTADALADQVAADFELLLPLMVLASQEEPMPMVRKLLGSGPPPPPPPPPYPLSAVAAATALGLDTLERWVRAIHRKGQAILYGPPGTGKTFVARELAKHLVGGGDGFSDLVQFHPAYAYEDFIQGLRPRRGADGQLQFDMVPGRFLDFCARASRCSDTCVLIVDEINRAELSRVFGELMYLMEYRQVETPLAGGGKLQIPANVRLLGTMNTADRSIALVDHALRRRFAFLALGPQYDVLQRFHQGKAFRPDGLVRVLHELNQKIADPHYEVGISYFLRDDLAGQLEDVWRMEIEPYLEEYFFDRRDVVDQFRWDRVRARMQE